MKASMYFNYTTRSLLRKMEVAGEVRHSDGQYLAVSVDSRHSQWPPLSGNNHKEQHEKQQPTSSAAIDDVDYSDYADDD